MGTIRSIHINPEIVNIASVTVAVDPRGVRVRVHPGRD
jgi:hypothetical protein